MIRKQVYITNEQNERIKALKNKTGAPESEIIRRALDEYIKKSANSKL